jgi:threonine aldolase
MSDPRALDFRSDNVAGVAPEVLSALAVAAQGSDSAYGADATTKRLEAQLAELFAHEVAIFPVATGTAANSLALAHAVPGWGAVLCHREAHIATDECGAPEFFSGGAKLITLDGEHGKLSADTVARELARELRGVHHPQPKAVSISQSTETGAVYVPEEIAEIAAACRPKGLTLHMDGARLANAVASLGCAAADVTWRAGVDILSFGLTKNGAMAAEAVIFFDAAQAEDFAFRRKRGGHLFSKLRFVSAQFEAQLTNGLWLKLAGHANAMAARIAADIQALPGIGLLHPVEANELFLLLPERAIARLEQDGYRFYRWENDRGPCIRLVTAFDTSPEAVEGLVRSLSEAV